MKKKELGRIVSQRKVADSIYELIVKAELTNEIVAPGQFVHIKVGEGMDPLLRRPISIAAVHREANTFTMIYRKEGRGTTSISEKEAGSRIDILGPLGNGFPVGEVEKGQTALLVGGGIGVPPLYELSKALRERGVNVIHVLGFQTETSVFYEKEFESLGDTFVATVDGSYAYKGYVTDVINQENIDFDVMYACGPTPMLKALEQSHKNKKVYLSLEERMGCGIGACFACVCPLQDDPSGHAYRKVCSDGPVFRAGEVLI